MQMLSEYLSEKGLSCKPEGKEKRTSCPFCKDEKSHLYIDDEKGVFFCHKCSEAGNIWKLKKFYGDLTVIEYSGQKKKFSRPTPDTDKKYQADLIQGKDYLKGRGLKDETIKKFNIGQYKDFIAIPYYKNGELVNFKYRGISEKKFQRFKDAESTLYNIDNIDPKKDVIVVEGELDAVSCDQMGESNVISVSIGAGGWNPDWLDFFEKCSGNFYIAFDNDEKGKEGAKKLSEKIGIHKTRRLKLPLKDFNDCLMAGYGAEDLKGWISSAEEYKLPNLIHISDIFQRMDDLYKKGDRGCGIKLSGWKDLNERLGGFRESEITVVTGDTSSGKSMFTKNIFLNLVSQGEKVLIASTEENIEDVVASFFTMYAGKNFKDFTDEDYQKCLLWFVDKPFYFVDIHGRLSIEQIDDYITYTSVKYDVKYILLDHLHFFIRRTSDNPVQDIENFIFDLVALAKRTRTNVWLVAHPSKLDNDKGVVHMNDIKGSSAIKQDAHNVITIRRDRGAEEKGFNEVVINFEKVRHTAGTGGAKRYIFIPESLSYVEKVEGTNGDSGYKKREVSRVSADWHDKGFSKD
jgi:twinkle protein